MKTAERDMARKLRREQGLSRIAQYLYGATQEYGGFDRPEWL